jgi:hypothetical protein
MARGSGLTDLLVVHPQETVFVGSTGPVDLSRANTWFERLFRAPDNLTMAVLDTQWRQLCHRLLDLGYVFDFGDERILADCGRIEFNDGRPTFRVNKACYRAVLVPPVVTLRASTLDLLERFVLAGGNVFYLGDDPRMIDGRDDPGASKRLAAVLPLFAHVSDVDEHLIATSGQSGPLARTKGRAPFPPVSAESAMALGYQRQLGLIESINRSNFAAHLGTRR